MSGGRRFIAFIFGLAVSFAIWTCMTNFDLFAAFIGVQKKAIFGGGSSLQPPQVSMPPTPMVRDALATGSEAGRESGTGAAPTNEVPTAVAGPDPEKEPKAIPTTAALEKASSPGQADPEV